MVKDYHKILEDTEKVKWEGKPTFLPFFISSFIISIFGLFFLIPGALAFFAGIASGNFILIAFPHFWIGLFVTFGIPLYSFLVYKYMHYVITNKRVIIQKGLIGRDFEIVDFDQMTNSEVNVNLIDKLFGNSSGSIKISTAGSFTYHRGRQVHKPYTLAHVQDPYNVFKFLKKVSHDVKTDIHYPNKLRPKENPGYTTELK